MIVLKCLAAFLLGAGIIVVPVLVLVLLLEGERSWQWLKDLGGRGGRGGRGGGGSAGGVAGAMLGWDRLVRPSVQHVEKMSDRVVEEDETGGQ